MKSIRLEKMTKKFSHSMHNYHSHIFYEIYILTSGTRKMLFDNALYELSAPACVVIPPHTLHRTEGDEYERYDIYALTKGLNEIEKSILDKISLIPIFIQSDEKIAIVDMLEEMLKYQDTPTDESNYAIHVLAASVLLLLLKNVQNSNGDHSSLQRLPYSMIKILDYFKYNYDKKITLDSVADQFFMAKTSIIYNFKKYLNCSPIDYLLKIRMTKAKEMLLNPEKKSIEEIAKQCGFACGNYFTEIFKKREGLSPTMYRKFNYQRQ